MDWILIGTALPPLEERVMVVTEEGSELYAVRSLLPDGVLFEYVDDSNCILRSPVVRWAYLVSPDETP